jgi:hypothetical protein
MEGVSMALQPAMLTATANDLPASWCTATTAAIYETVSNNHGTPGAVNVCP